MDKEYDLSIIKIAFWKTFHEAGELWFGCFPECKEHNQETTEFEWNEFVDNLEDADLEDQNKIEGEIK